MKKDIKDIAASVRQRLLNKAKETNRPFDELLQYFAMERFLYRLSQSKYKDKVILKGALMFAVWNAPRSRATRDIDFLGKIESKLDKLSKLVQDVCEIEVEDDGLIFDSKTVKVERIKEDADYEGVRARLTGRLGQPKVFIQIDFGFGDKVFPKPLDVDYPSLLGMLRPQLKGYPQETVIAEKFQAMVDLGMLNSRMKDFYDIWLLASQFNFDGATLKKSIAETFARRKTEIITDPVALTDEFSLDAAKNIQWKAFIRKNRLDHAPAELKTVTEVIKRFLKPIATPANEEKETHLVWHAAGSWTDKRNH